MKDGGSGVLAKKSAIGVVGGWANSFVCKHSSIKGVRKISGVWNKMRYRRLGNVEISFVLMMQIRLR
jgi:hypothetical protein